MTNYKAIISKKICYTHLVYGRINKKLGLRLSHKEIEKFILETIEKTIDANFVKKGKNIYISNNIENIRLTINSNTNRIITADKIK